MKRLMACTALALAGTALAQDRPPPPPRDGAPPALRGPRVQEDRVPGMDGSFGQGRPDARMGGGRVPPGALMEAVAKLRGNDAPEDLRLTPKQEAQIRALHEEMAAMRPGRPQEGDAQAQRRAMAERVQEGQTRAFAILTDRQKEFVKGEIEKARKDSEGRMGEQRLERRMRERAQPGQPPAPRDAAPDGGPMPRERLRHIAELLGQLSPDEREQFLSRIERALEERVSRGHDADAPRRARPGAEDRPPQGRPDDDDRPPEGARPRRPRPQGDEPPPRRNPPD